MEREIRRGDRAAQLLKSRSFKDALEECIQDEFVSFTAGDPLDEDILKAIHARVQAYAMLKGKLENWRDVAVSHKEQLARENQENGTR